LEGPALRLFQHDPCEFEMGAHIDERIAIVLIEEVDLVFDGPDAEASIVVLEVVACFVHGARHLQDAFDPFLTPPLGALMSGADPVH
jgi:hypothetical protein